MAALNVNPLLQTAPAQRGNANSASNANASQSMQADPAQERPSFSQVMKSAKEAAQASKQPANASTQSAQKPDTPDAKPAATATGDIGPSKEVTNPSDAAAASSSETVQAKDAAIAIPADQILDTLRQALAGQATQTTQESGKVKADEAADATATASLDPAVAAAMANAAANLASPANTAVMETANTAAEAAISASTTASSAASVAAAAATNSAAATTQSKSARAATENAEVVADDTGKQQATLTAQADASDAAQRLRVANDAAGSGNAGAGQSNRESAITTATTDVQKSANGASESAVSTGNAPFANQLDQARQALAANGRSVAPEANRPAEHAIATPVATRGWSDEVGQRLSWVVHHDNGRAELVLNPAHLGRVEVTINMNGDQATASFVAANPAAREALQDALPRLREVLNQAGIQLGQANVSSGNGGQAQADQRPAAPAFAAMSKLDAVAELPLSGSRGLTGSGRGMIDTFA